MESIRYKIKHEEDKSASPNAKDLESAIYSSRSDYLQPINDGNRKHPKKYFDVGVLTPTKIEHVKMTKWSSLVKKLKVERQK